MTVEEAREKLRYLSTLDSEQLIAAYREEVAQQLSRRTGGRPERIDSSDLRYTDNMSWSELRNIVEALLEAWHNDDGSGSQFYDHKAANIFSTYKLI
jgi:hypothetical protein